MASSSSSSHLHVIFMLFPSPGHMTPMVDMAKTVSSRSVTATIVVTDGNAHRIRQAIADHKHIALRTIPFPSDSAVPENTTGLPTPELTSEFVDAMDGLEGPFEKLMHELNHSPDCIVADSLFPWSSDVASRLGIPRIVFCSSGSFPCVVMTVLGHARPQDRVAESDDRPFLLPGLPHEIRMARTQLPKDLRWRAGGGDEYWMDFMARIVNATPRSFGIVTNSFYEMESEYTDMYRKLIAPKKVWNVGPVSLWNQLRQDPAVTAAEEDDCMRWLESKKPSSVIYICFGSLGQFTGAQLREMALGLESCAHPFVWVVRDECSEWMPEGFEERVVETGKGLVIRGWAPQEAILNCRAVGGFVTHCGWNSTLEGVAAGVPMVTWPLMHDQFFNERLIVDVLRIGVDVGSRSSSFLMEERSLVRGEQLRAAVDELMAKGGEAEERCRRAEKLAAMAKGAVDEGGSSYKDMADMIRELKIAKLQY